MNIRTIFENALPYVAGIGIPVGLAVACAALPIMYDLKGSVGELKSAVATIDKTQQKDAEQIVKKIEQATKQIELLLVRAKDSETDPSMLLARQGIQVEQGYSFALIDGATWLFPKTKEAEIRLMKAGYSKAQITPVIAGYAYITESTGNPPGAVTPPPTSFGNSIPRGMR